MQTITLTDEQRAAVESIKRWFGDGMQHGAQFKIGGYAGTGKTTLIDFIRDMLDVDIKTLAPTGKAAQVLRDKGVMADTIHSYVYNFRGLQETGKQKFITDGDGGRHATEKMAPGFEDKMTLDESDRCDVIIVDEASMVNDKLYADLIAFLIPIIWVGDHGQLPPVGGDPGLMRDLDARLETIHRQAADNPILQLAQHVREGNHPRSFKVEPSNDKLKIGASARPARIVEVSIERGYDQILVPFNKLRHQINREYRRQKFGTNEAGVMSILPGERVICTLNNRKLGFFNGMIFTVNEILEWGRDTVTVRVQPEGSDLERKDPITMYLPEFGDQADDQTRSTKNTAGILMFDYGYAITTHKSQGSEWDSVLVLDAECKYWDNKRWRYTAYTRAKNTLAVAIM